MNVGVESVRCCHGNVGVCPWCMVRRKVDELRALRGAVRSYKALRQCGCDGVPGRTCEACVCFDAVVAQVERGDHHAGAE